ncbi:MAG: N-acetylmuramoyl-L-alanine amidase [Bernardetiaceae bacterium]|jgi:N-acetylmuramoyl-L-alanine amidase|nr:N-acetylmuramoyl-L-alanine amidase [Bernardetiaceae bacterium]
MLGCKLPQPGGYWWAFLLLAGLALAPLSVAWGQTVRPVKYNSPAKKRASAATQANDKTKKKTAATQAHGKTKKKTGAKAKTTARRSVAKRKTKVAAPAANPRIKHYPHPVVHQTVVDRRPEAPFTVVIDPGHGGYDPGNERSQATYLHEKVINLAIGLQVGQMIEDNLSNVKVIYTRKTDVYRSLEDRVLIANTSEADCFISIHCNSNPSSGIRGVQLHIHDHAFLKSKKLAQAIDYEIKTSAGRRMRGIFNAKDRQHNLYVLQNTTMPGVLLEAGFMSHAAEEKFLNTDEGQEAIALATFRGFVNYLAKIGYEVKIKSSPDVEAAAKRDPSAVAPGKYVYKVQITASDKRIPLRHPDFKKLRMKIEEHEAPNDRAVYKYRYTVGGEDTLAEANDLARRVRGKGFGDAFVARFKRE